MVVRWNQYEIQLSCFVVLAVLYEIRECDSLNPEGLALLEFRERIENDPYGAFSNWNSNHSQPCMWLGVQCIDEKVQVLDLSGLSLQGTLAPSLRKLRYLKSIVMSNNSLSGSIPKEFGELKLLELLDLSHNHLSGSVPIEISRMPSLKCLLLCGNDFDEHYTPATRLLDCDLASECDHLVMWLNKGPTDYMKRIGRCSRTNYHNYCFTVEGENCNQIISRFGRKTSRRLSEESSNVVAALTYSAETQKNAPISLTSGAFSALTKDLPVSTQPSTKSFPQESLNKTNEERPKRNVLATSFVICLIIALLITLLFLGLLIFLRSKHESSNARAKDATLLHRLSKAFVTGIPRLNSSELQTACEDFSNIIETFSGCLMYKGILSSGVEIAVLSTSIRSLRQWSTHADKEFKSKLNTLSKINHKNFVNVIGYCEEEDPFVRMMVLEYAPNGNLYEHLHVKEMEHLDWSTRMKVIMGTCYCLEYMHHELTPPVIHPNLQSDSILLTDDYSAKVVDVTFWADIVAKSKISDNEELEPLHSHPGPNREDNVYSLGILLLEIVSTKSFNAQAMQCLSDKEYTKLVDPSLKSFKNEELEVICEVILECIKEDQRERATMKDITAKLREATRITPEAATSRFSPLWWAELEILSMDSG